MTAKEKSRRTADILTRPYEAAALIFRAAVSFCSKTGTFDDPLPCRTARRQ